MDGGCVFAWRVTRSRICGHRNMGVVNFAHACCYRRELVENKKKRNIFISYNVCGGSVSYKGG